MSDLTITPAGVTMSSREIAELTGKRHDHVLRDIRAMLTELHGEDRLPSFEETVVRPNPSGGAPIKSTALRLPRREVEILLTGYSVPLRAKVIDRLRELEDKPKPPAELSHLEILQLAIDSGQKLIAAEAERDKAIRDAVVTVEQVLHGLLGKASPGNVLQVSHRNPESPGAKRTRAYRERKKAAAESSGVIK
ncbi:Rha family transcriptional regulator [Pseudomonas leptonychotis]|uniref:Rha family transcriptional regulator n=1 Tax=Pseudomonas leptonychotis TaxID=2448482 RepID=UPI00386EB1A9